VGCGIGSLTQGFDTNLAPPATLRSEVEVLVASVANMALNGTPRCFCDHASIKEKVHRRPAAYILRLFLSERYGLRSLLFGYHGALLLFRDPGIVPVCYLLSKKKKC
jgi:hypothetical protein